MENTKKIDIVNTVIISSVAIIILLVGYLAYISIKNNLISLPKNLTTLGNTSPNINSVYLSSPINNIYSTKIIDKSKDYITIETNTIFPPESVNKTVRLKIKSTEKTNITKVSTNIPYYFNNLSTPVLQATPSSEVAVSKLTTQDLDVGALVNVDLTSDLRFTNNDSLVANNITQLSLSNNLIQGKITKITSNSLTVDGYLPSNVSEIQSDTSPTPQPTRSYIIQTTSETEIASFDTTETIKITISDLKIGDIVNVYSSASINGTSFTAALINKILIIQATPIPSITPEPTANTPLAPIPPQP